MTEREEMHDMADRLEILLIDGEAGHEPEEDPVELLCDLLSTMRKVLSTSDKEARAVDTALEALRQILLGGENPEQVAVDAILACQVILGEES